MGKFATSRSLASASLDVLKKDKVLAAIPFASAITSIVIVTLFSGVAYFSLEHVVNPAPGQNEFSATPLTWAVGIVGLLIVTITAQFFAATLVAGANERLDGGDPTLGSAMSKAFTRSRSIVGWSLLNATVGLILQQVREKAGVLGSVLAFLGGAAWNVATWLVLPIIIVEGLGPIAAVKRSVALLKQTWGENLIAQAGLGLVSALLMLPGIAVATLLMMAIPLLGISLMLIWIFAIASIISALGAVYRTALYRFAVGLPAGGAFTDAQLAAAFRAKNSRIG